MSVVRATDLPSDALLGRFAAIKGVYTDCYAARIPRAVTLPEFVQAFYTGRLFRVERWILKVAAMAPSTDADANAVANGAQDDFAVWVVEDRAANELLMHDQVGQTRSWFKVEPDGTGTVLLFGSAVVGRGDGKAMPVWIRLLMPLHQIYARLLLRGALGVLRRQSAGIA